MITIKKIEIQTIRPWADTRHEEKAVAVEIDGTVVGYVWKKERRFPVTAGMIKIGETTKKVYAYSFAGNPEKIEGYTKTREKAVQTIADANANVDRLFSAIATVDKAGNRS